MDDFAEFLERCFIEEVLDILKAKGMKNIHFSAKVWPDRSSQAANSRWNVIKGLSSKTGQPQRLIFSDSQRMAEVLEIDLAYLVLRAKNRALEKFEENQNIKGKSAAQSTPSAGQGRRLKEKI
jgi:hypothetical protein